MSDHPNDVQVEALRLELQELKARFGELEQHKAQRSTWRSRRWLLIAALAAVCVASTALASTLTDGLFVFNADEPALASEVNANFSTLRQYLRNKVGTDLTTGNIIVPGTLTASGGKVVAGTGGITATGADFIVSNGRFMGTNPSNNLHIDNTVTTGSTYLNWFGGKTVVIGNGDAATTNATFDSGGKLTMRNGVSGGGRVCLAKTNCAWEGNFGCGGQMTCSGNKMMFGFQDGTSCSVVDAAYCCDVVLTTGCP